MIKKVQRWKPSLAFYNLENAAIFEFKPAFYLIYYDMSLGAQGNDEGPR